uniref:F-box domain-containing protein n=1 Tax=Brassica oleracea var. oleracea TaxID=109376 RepID=A0A0D2ZTU8_BRAOL
MDSATSTIHHLPESILTEILARLPLRSNSRLKTVSKTVKATLESVYFRRIFVSLHKNSSSSWSLGSREGDELIGFHGCKTWDVPKSLGSFISLPLGFEFKASSNGLVLIERYGCGYSYVGNPVLQQWVKIPQLPCGYCGIWTSKILQCPHLITKLVARAKNLNVLAHDFFSDSDQFMVVHLPEHSNHNNNGVVNGALTTSGGFVMYMKSLVQKRGTVLKVWRLNHDQSWQLLCEINGLSISGSFVPIAMHPFDSDIVYRWHQESPRHLVSCNLRTETLIDPAREYHGDFYMNQSGFEEYMDEIGRLRASDRDYTILIGLFQSVLPRWMESVPRPPQVDMIDTTSLPSYVACCLIEQDE